MQLKQCVVKIPELNTIYVVAMLKEYLNLSEGVEIVKDEWVEVPLDIADWPYGEVRPPCGHSESARPIPSVTGGSNTRMNWRRPDSNRRG